MRISADAGDGGAGASPASRAGQGELSWQQLAWMRKESERGERYGNCHVRVELSEDVTLDRIRQRLVAMVCREEVMRIVGIAYPDDHVEWSAEVEIPLPYFEASSTDEVDEIMAKMERSLFSRVGPLWSVGVVDHPDAYGRRTRSVCAVIDHLIIDGYGVQLFSEEIRGGALSDAHPERRRFSDWVRWQREHYPLDVTRPTRERKFWLRYLDGTAPDRASSLPFCSDVHGVISGTMRTVGKEVPFSAVQLQQAARRTSVTPFVIVLAAVCASISLIGGDTDVVLRVSRVGRPDEFLDVQGLFADDTPVRVQHPSLADPRCALRAASSGWLEVLDHLTAPAYYILGVHAGNELPPTTHRPAQVMLNFFPWPIELPMSYEVPREKRTTSVTGLQLAFFAATDGRCFLHCGYDPARFASGGVEGFLDVIEQNLAWIAST